MKTRTTEYFYYSPEEIIINKFKNNLKILISNYNNVIYSNDDVEKINSVLCIIIEYINNVNSIINIIKKNQNKNYMGFFEKQFRIIINKQKEFKKEVKILSLYEKNNNETFKKISNELVIKCNNIASIVYGYFNIKYMFILHKTNADIFRIVMSYIY